MDINGLLMGYPLVNIQKTIEHGPVEIVDFPMNSMVDLSIAMLNYQRSKHHKRPGSQNWVPLWMILKMILKENS